MADIESKEQVMTVLNRVSHVKAIDTLDSVRIELLNNLLKEKNELTQRLEYIEGCIKRIDKSAV